MILLAFVGVNPSYPPLKLRGGNGGVMGRKGSSEVFEK
jgi:hypothetical protein